MDAAIDSSRGLPAPSAQGTANVTTPWNTLSRHVEVAVTIPTDCAVQEVKFNWAYTSASNANISTGVYVYSGTSLVWNSSWEEIFGYSGQAFSESKIRVVTPAGVQGTRIHIVGETDAGDGTGGYVGLDNITFYCSSYIPIVKQTPGDSFDFNFVPFEYGGVNVAVGYPGYPSSQSIDLTGHTGIALHLITTAGYAPDLPTGTRIADLIVHYQDSSTDNIPLVIGQNTAEWAYDRPELQNCLAHNKIRAREAYNYVTTADSQYEYVGHDFYTAAPIQPKPLASVELAINPLAGQASINLGCGYWPEAYVAVLKGLTIQIAGGGGGSKRQSN